MSRAPARRPLAAPAAEPHCANNDCQREQAAALTRLANTAEAFQAEFHQLKPLIENIGEIAGKWLGFCGFMRRWFPRVGWWLLPIAVTLLTKGAGEGADALFAALTALAHSQTGAVG